MNVITHYPEDSKNIEILKNKLGKIYGDGVKHYINSLNCNKSQKLELLKQIIKERKEGFT